DVVRDRNPVGLPRPNSRSYVALGRANAPERSSTPRQQARGFSRPLTNQRNQPKRNHEADRSPSPHQEPRDGRRGGHVRPPGRRDSPGVRPADRLADPPPPRPSR